MDLDDVIADLQRKKSDHLVAAELIDQKLGILAELKSEYGSRNGSARAGSEPAPTDTATPQSVTQWNNLTRARAILVVLHQANEPLSPAQIAERLQRHGREKDIAKYVSAELVGLKKTGKVVRTGFGQWSLADRRFPSDERIGDMLIGLSEGRS
jgi:hypothetical protein